MAVPTRSKLTVIHGPMFSGKTTRLINLIKNNKHALGFKPSIDDRYSEKPLLVSHDRREVNASVIDADEPQEIVKVLSRPINRHVTTVVIDESNFFNDQLIQVIIDLKANQKDIIVAGLALDSEKQEFGPTKKLAKLADTVEELFARCDYGQCKVKAKFTYAKTAKSSQLVVGAGDLYGPACTRHYPNLHHPPKPKSDLIEYGIFPPFVEWLEDMDLPYIRQKASTLPQNNYLPRIEIGADSMRIGKTTAVKVIAQGLKQLGYRVEESYEDLDHNPHLKKSYSDPSEALLKSQKWFAKRKYDQIKSISMSAIFIQDVHPEMDFGYALTNALMGRMSLKQFETYQTYFHSLEWSKTKFPDLLIYLTASDPILVDRAHRSTRDFETIEPEYFLIMKTVNRRWLDGARKKMQILEVDTDDFDFSLETGSKKQQQELVRRVVDQLKLQ